MGVGGSSWQQAHGLLSPKLLSHSALRGARHQQEGGVGRDVYRMSGTVPGPSASSALPPDQVIQPKYLTGYLLPHTVHRNWACWVPVRGSCREFGPAFKLPKRGSVLQVD